MIPCRTTRHSHHSPHVDLVCMNCVIVIGKRVLRSTHHQHTWHELQKEPLNKRWHYVSGWRPAKEQDRNLKPFFTRAKIRFIIKVEEVQNSGYQLFTPNTSKLIVSYLKCTFKTQTVVQTDSDTKIIVKRRYFPSSGTANDVGGMISASSRKNTVNDTRIEMQSVTWKKIVMDAIKINESIIGRDVCCVTADDYETITLRFSYKLQPSRGGELVKL